MLPRSLRDAAVAFHHRGIHVPRVRRIASALAEHAGPCASLLDVGCGTGEVARLVAERAGASRVSGVDILVRPEVHIPVQPYDGETLPFADGAFEAVMLSDVLHHCPRPAVVLREALRVAARVVLLKDHFAFGPLSRLALLGMDHVGNAGPGVHVEGTYLDFAGWVALASEAGGRFSRLTWPLVVHELPFRLITRAEWQFVASVERAAPATNSA
jgi:SAM-dependent methyltransferase